eukprot:4337205-Amphidinium_carterae.2
MAPVSRVVFIDLESAQRWAELRVEQPEGQHRERECTKYDAFGCDCHDRDSYNGEESISWHCEGMVNDRIMSEVEWWAMEQSRQRKRVLLNLDEWLDGCLGTIDEGTKCYRVLAEVRQFTAFAEEGEEVMLVAGSE